MQAAVRLKVIYAPLSRGNAIVAIELEGLLFAKTTYSGESISAHIRIQPSQARQSI